MPDECVRDEYAGAFDPREYLRQYYSRPRLAEDDAQLFRTLCAWLKGMNRTFASALDIGCGPTIHNSFALAPYAMRIDLADYLQANLEEVQRWVAKAPEAHDWDPLLRGVLACERTDESLLEARKSLHRSRITALLPCDLRQAEPLGRPARYDLVTSFFCAECVAASWEQWRAMMIRLLDLVEPGGAVFLAAVRECTRYRVLGRWFSSISVTEREFLDLLPDLGFPGETIAVHKVPAPDWSDDGFDHICLVAAIKGAAPGGTRR